ncbi:MAG: recombinase family protein [Bdellovibrionaceae bacterium]|nr:recombinase family protein [Pseudobdellovibrionaceae bacterium]
MTFRIAGYSRVSTDEQASVVEGSLDNQRHRMKSFVDIKNLQDKNWGHVVDFYVDDGYSAGDTNRPQYQRLIKDIKSGKVNMVMVTELSRLSRDIPDFCVLKKLFDEHHVSFLSIKEQFDTSTPAGELMLYQLISLSASKRQKEWQ